MADAVAKAFDFVDLEGRDRGYAIVRLCEPVGPAEPALVEFALSLEHGGDVELSLVPQAAREIAATIGGALDSHRAASHAVVSASPVAGGIRVTVTADDGRRVPFALPSPIAHGIAAALLQAAAAGDGR